MSAADGGAKSRCDDWRAIGLEGGEDSSVGSGVTAPTTFENAGSTSIEYDFGGDRDVDRDHYLSLRLPGAKASDIFVSMPLPLAERPGVGKGVFPTRNKQLAYTVAAGRGAIEIQFCLDPKLPRAAKAGSYQGALLIEGTNVKPLSVPINVDIRESNDGLVWLVAFGGLLIALIVKTLGDLAKDPKTKISKAGLKSYAGRWNFAFQVFGGLVLMVVTVWQLYYSSSDFGGQTSDWGALAGAIGVSVVSGISLASFLDFGKSSQVMTTPVAATPEPPETRPVTE